MAFIAFWSGLISWRGLGGSGDDDAYCSCGLHLLPGPQVVTKKWFVQRAKHDKKWFHLFVIIFWSKHYKIVNTNNKSDENQFFTPTKNMDVHLILNVGFIWFWMSGFIWPRMSGFIWLLNSGFICLRMSGFIWLGMSQIHDYKCRSDVTTNVAYMSTNGAYMIADVAYMTTNVAYMITNVEYMNTNVRPIYSDVPFLDFFLNIIFFLEFLGTWFSCFSRCPWNLWIHWISWFSVFVDGCSTFDLDVNRWFLCFCCMAATTLNS